MKRDPHISIIMAAYNAEKTIKAAIESVLAQSYSNWELLVIDDCSCDRTISIVNTYQDQRIRLLCNTVNLGVSRARKRGLDRAKGEWIAILDSDDVWRADKLEKQMSLAKEKDAQLVFSGSAFKEEGFPGNFMSRQK